MTRTQVARRLGKSIATVRRAEGIHLHPTRDARGVHRFDPDEVETLALEIENGAVSLMSETGAFGTSASDEPDIVDCPHCAVLARELDAAREELAEQRRVGNRALASLRIEHAREVADYERQARELVAQVEELVATVT